MSCDGPTVVDLLIDAGNTRIKWGLRSEAGSWLVRGALPLADVADLARLINVQPRRIMVCNVAGDAVAACLQAALAATGVPLAWASSGRSAGGVRNGYEQPGQLGVDRWAAVVGAWQIEQRPCLVVTAGTATTIDLLDRDPDDHSRRGGMGLFCGGLILPGFDLMRTSLARNTAQLPLAEVAEVAEVAGGLSSNPPRNTMEAIITGCLFAQVGAIERMARRLPQDGAILLSGGNAELLSPQLSLPHRRVDNLVLEGLARLLA